MSLSNKNFNADAEGFNLFVSKKHPPNSDIKNCIPEVSQKVILQLKIELFNIIQKQLNSIKIKKEIIKEKVGEQKSGSQSEVDNLMPNFENGVSLVSHTLFNTSQQGISNVKKITEEDELIKKMMASLEQNIDCLKENMDLLNSLQNDSLEEIEQKGSVRKLAR